MITNEEFLRAVFGDQFNRAWVTGYENDPNEAKGQWLGGEYRNGGRNKIDPPDVKNTFFSISTFKENNGKVSRTKSLFDQCHVIVLDDIGTKIDPLSIDLEYNIKPSYIIETSPSNYQYGYLLKTGETRKDLLEFFFHQLGEKELSDKGMEGVNRYARLPVGCNTKQKYGDKGFKHRLIVWEPNITYSLEEIASGFGIPLDQNYKAVTSELKELSLPDHDPILEALGDIGLVKSHIKNKQGAFDITCPWVLNHTDAADNGTAYFQPGYTFGSTQYENGAFKCHHGSCADKHLHDLRHYLAESFPQKVSEFFNIDFEVLENSSLESIDDNEDLLTNSRIDDWITHEPNPQVWLIDKSMPVNKVGMLVGPGGTGKGFLMWQAAIACATGSPFAGVLQFNEPGGVYYVNEEEDKDDQHRRFCSVIDYLKESIIPVDSPEIDLNLAVKNIYRDSFIKKGEPNLLTSKINNQCKPTALVEYLVKKASQIPNLKLIILDPIVSFRGGDENSTEDTTVFVNTLRYIASKTKTAIIGVHQTSKSVYRYGDDTQGAARGSSSLTDGARWQAQVRVMTAREAQIYGLPEEQAGRFVKMVIPKNNYGPYFEPVWLERMSNGVLHKTNLKIEAEDKDKEEENLDLLFKIKELIEYESEHGREYSTTKFIKTFSGQDGRLEATRSRVEEAIRIGLDTGHFEESDPKEKGKGLKKVIRHIK